MSLLQDTLPFKRLSAKTFDHYMGNVSVVNVLQEPDKLPQFCYIWGEEFSGKTHLLDALCDQLNINNTQYLMLESSTLIDGDITAVISGNVKFILVDDVDHMIGVESNEVALFNFYNYCKSEAINLVVTAAVHPKDPAWVLPDLISRLNAGLTLALEPIKGQAAIDCIAKQFSLNGMPLDTSVIHYLQAHYTSTYPALFRLFLSVSSESLKLKRKVTVPLIKQAIKESES